MTKKLNPVDMLNLQHREASVDKPLPPMDDAFFNEHQSIIESIAISILNRGNLPTGVEFGDLMSWGGEGLMKAHRNYRPDRGSSFKTYAYYRIRGEIYDHVRSEWQYRNPTDYSEQRRRIQERIADVVEEALEHSEDISGMQLEEKMNTLIYEAGLVYLVSLDAHDEMDVPVVVNDAPVDAQNSELWDAIETLNSEEREIVDLFYVQGLKQKEISEKLNQSRSRVCRVHMKVLEKLRRRLQTKALFRGG